MRIVAALALVAAAAAAVPARGDEIPPVEQIVARARAAAAADRRPGLERETWAVRAHALEGTEISVRRGNDVSSMLMLGPFHTARGIAGGTRWHQNENGQTVVDGADAGPERVVAQSVARARDPAGALVVTSGYESGHVGKTYYDARTMLVVRSEKLAAGRTAWTAFDDFRSDARGRTRAWHVTGGAERGQRDYDYRLLRDDVPPAVAPELVAAPPDRRLLFAFPEGTDSARLPARVEAGRIYVRLHIAGRGLDFLLDSGASNITIDGDVARELGLPRYGRTRQTVAGTFIAERAIASDVTVGPLVAQDLVMHTGPLAHREGSHTRVVGLLGYDFIAALGLRIDYANGTVDAFRPGTLRVPDTALPIGVRLSGEVPVASAVVGGALGEDFIVDTGAQFGLVVFQRFARAHSGAITIDESAPPRTGTAVGGTLQYRPITSRRIELGPFRLDRADEVEAVSPAALGFDDRDGLVGSELLRRFTVYLDYAAHRIFLTPTTRSSHP